MKRILTLILVTAMIMTAAIIPAHALPANEKLSADTTQPIDVSIPKSAKCVIDNGEPVYYDFYDSTNHYTYAYYAPESHRYFRISDPIEVPLSETDMNILANSLAEKGVVTAKSLTLSKKIAHYYSYEGSAVINGNSNGVTFSIPDNPNNGYVYIDGSSWIENPVTGLNTTGNYSNYSFKITLVKKGLSGYSKQKSFIAGGSVYGSYSGCSSGNHYLIVTPVDRLNSMDNLCGQGSVYYYR